MAKRDAEIDEVRYRSMTPWEQKDYKKRIYSQKLQISLTINFNENERDDFRTKK